MTQAYDANGNLTHECFRNKAEVTYQYDTENRLVAVYDQQKLLVASTYDGDGNRAFQLNYNPGAECGYGMNVSGEVFMPEHSVEEDGSLTAEGKLFSYICSKTGRAYDLTEYVNDTNRQYTEALTAYTVNSGATESYSYAGGQRLSRNNIWDEAQGVHCNQSSYYLYDGRGSVTANTWYNGMVTDVYQYDPYGQVTLGSTEHTDFYGYNAESYNPNSGLEYLRARYYNAKQGRFFQEDTYLGAITDPLTLNRYAYVKNSPMNYIDPSGHVAASSYAAAYQPEQEASYNPIPTSAASHDAWPANYQRTASGSNAIAKGRNRIEELCNEAKRKAGPYLEKCDAFMRGYRVGEASMWAQIDNLFIGNALHFLGIDTSAYTSKEEMRRMYVEGYEDLEPTEENVYLYKLGNEVGAWMAWITIVGSLTTSMTGALSSGTQSAQVMAPDGSVQNLEIPNGIILEDGTIILNPSIIMQTSPDGGGEKDNEGESKPDNPEDYLNEALERQGLDKTPKNMKESWTADGYKYEVRVHEANPEYGKEGSIYRVSRKKLGTNANGQGYGTEYLDTDGVWHHTSTLKPQNPSYNAEAAANTHIPVH